MHLWKLKKVIIDFKYISLLRKDVFLEILEAAESIKVHINCSQKYMQKKSIYLYANKIMMKIIEDAAAQILLSNIHSHICKNE